jgi:hypothetical protein
MQKMESVMKNAIVHIPVFIFISSELYRHNTSVKEKKRWSLLACKEKYCNLMSNQYFTKDAQQHLGDNLLLYIRRLRDNCKKIYNYTTELLLHIIKYVT